MHSDLITQHLANRHYETSASEREFCEECGKEVFSIEDYDIASDTEGDHILCRICIENT